MEMNEYQKLASRTATFNSDELDEKEFARQVAYLALGVTGEAGEVAEKVKKILRDDEGSISDEKKEELKKELGDVLWYLSQMARMLGYSFEDVAQTNIDKLWNRHKRDVIKGEGDNR